MTVVKMPDGVNVDFGDLPPDQIRSLIQQKFPEETAAIASQMAKTRREMGFGDRISEDYARRIGKMENSAQAFVKGEQSGLETGIQQGLQYAQLAPDVATEAMVSGFRALPDSIENSIRKGAKSVYSGLADTAIGRVLGGVADKYQDFATENPRAARNIGAVGNAGNLAVGFLPINGSSAIARAGEAGGDAISLAAKGAKTGAGTAAYPFLKTGVGAARVLDKAAESVASGVSRNINRAGLPLSMSGLSDAEALFVQTLKNEGVSIADALNSLYLAKAYKATPSVAITANIPHMQTQAYLMSRGSSGSKVASNAIKNIDEVQIPSMNKKIIDSATGGRILSAEQYGEIVSGEAKKLVEQKAAQLRTRAKPYYERSVGLDKSVPIEAPEMKNALGNPLVVKALEESRTDPFTLSNTIKELSDLGIDARELQKLPYNSTISLHAARVHLRQMADAAFSSGERMKGGAIKNALGDIDNAIESAFPDYKTARRLYSEDAGALKVLKDSPVGRMSQFAEGDFSKIANGLMTKDAQYIKKFVNGLGDNQKMRDSIAGAFLKRQLEEAAFEGRRFSDKVFRTQGSSDRLRALVGNERFSQMKKIDDVIDSLVKTRNIPAQSITAAAQSVKAGVDVPTDKVGALMFIKKKISPSMFDLVQKNPEQAARFNELLFTDEGYKLLNKLNGKSKFLSPTDAEAVVNFLNKHADKIKEGFVK